MTNIIIKGNRYRLIDNKSFDLPLPLKFVVLKEDTEIAEYEVSAEESVSFRILTKFKEHMITPINRPLTIADVYYFLSSRVFQDKTPFTGFELSQLGLEKYNVFSIIKKTRGITPYDTYWVRFSGDNCDYETARENWDKLMSNAVSPVSPAEENAILTGTTPDSSSEPVTNVDEILNQHKIDIAATVAEHSPANNDNSVPTNSTMSAEEIEQLLVQSGLAEDTTASAPEPAPAASSSGGNLSPDEIAKLFASNDTPEPAPEPAPAASSSGGNLSPDEIAKLFASNDTPEPEPAPAASSSGGNLSPDEIAKLISENAAAEAPEPSTKPNDEIKAEAAKMSQEDIERMLSDVENETANTSPDEPAKADTAAAADNAPETEETTHADDAAQAATKPSGKMTQEDIEKMLNDQVNAVKETIDINAPGADVLADVASPAEDARPADDARPAEDAPHADNASPTDVASPAEDAAESDDGDRLSPEEIEALLGGMQKDAKT